jgi:hypothetical protein
MRSQPHPIIADDVLRYQEVVARFKKLQYPAMNRLPVVHGANGFAITLPKAVKHKEKDGATSSIYRTKT